MVEGTPEPCGSRETALRSALPNPLNAASTMMMTIPSVEEIDVERHPGPVRKGLEKLLDQFGVEGPDPRLPQLHMENKTGPHREVEGNDGQGLVHGEEAAAIPLDPLGLSQGFSHPFPEAESHILHRMMCVNAEIAFCFKVKVNAAVIGQQGEHVIEEGNACLDRTSPGPVQIDL